eukprot:COSAG02_NODE_11116_length_1790_cov_1.208161_1_plen_50_part_00
MPGVIIRGEEPDYVGSLSLTERAIKAILFPATTTTARESVYLICTSGHY